MQQRRNIILVLKPGTRKMPYAVSVDGVFIDYGTKYFKGKWSKKKLKKVLLSIEKLRQRYKPKKVELKVAHPSRRSEGVNELIKRI